MIGTLAGVTVFLVLLLFAAQVLLNLYAASVVTAAAFDAARIVAGAEGGPDRQHDAEQYARSLLGGYGQDASFAWSRVDTEGDGVADRVELRIVAPSPTTLLPGMAGRLPFQTVDRTVRVRIEQFVG
jgi:hypothetical protein